MNPLLQLYSHLPNLRGKLYLGDKLFKLVNPSGLYTQKMTNGFIMELDLSDRLQRLLFIKRTYESETSIALTPYLKTARGFIDIGANVGYFSLLAKSLNPNCHVVSVEPLPVNIDKLLRNQNINHFENMNVVAACISDTVGTTDFIVPPNEERGWGRIAYKPMFDGQRLQRPVETVDHLVSQLPINHVDVVKIDIEGFEFNALKGMEQTLQRHSPVVCIELNEPCLVDVGTSGNEILKWLKDRNYKTYSIGRSGKLIPAEQIHEDYAFLNYIAVPISQAKQNSV